MSWTVNSHIAGRPLRQKDSARSGNSALEAGLRHLSHLILSLSALLGPEQLQARKLFWGGVDQMLLMGPEMHHIHVSTVTALSLYKCYLLLSVMSPSQVEPCGETPVISHKGPVYSCGRKLRLRLDMVTFSSSKHASSKHA